MPRNKITLPGQFSFSTLIPIRITDINYGGHVGNDAVLSLVHEARTRFLAHYNYREMDIEGAGLIMIDAAIEFKSELFYGDMLTAYVAVQDFSRVGFDLYYKLVKNPGDTVAAIARTGMVSYDYQNKKLVSLPEEARAKLTS